MANGAGIGLIAQCARDWKDYGVAASIDLLVAQSWGLAARVQGRERYYALMFDRDDGGRFRLVRWRRPTIPRCRRLPVEFHRAYDLKLKVEGLELRAWIDGRLIFRVQEPADGAVDGGGIGLIVDSGSTRAVHIGPL